MDLLDAWMDPAGTLLRADAESGVVIFSCYLDADNMYPHAALFILEREWFRLTLEERCSLMSDFLKDLAKRVKAGQARTLEASDEELANTVPHVHELLTTRLKDGKAVLQPATLTVFARDGLFHCCCHHKALKLRWWARGLTLQTALEALEKAVSSEEGEEGA